MHFAYDLKGLGYHERGTAFRSLTVPASMKVFIMNRITSVIALNDYRLDISFEDGTQGVVDLSDLAGRGVFALWNDYAEFRKVRVGDTGELAWSDKIDLCPDSLYLKISGKRPEDVFPALQHELVHA
jgi:hypothetical protein